MAPAGAERRRRAGKPVEGSREERDDTAVDRAESDSSARIDVETATESAGDPAEDGDDTAFREERKNARPANDQFAQRRDAVGRKCVAVRNPRAVAQGTGNNATCQQSGDKPRDVDCNDRTETGD